MAFLPDKAEERIEESAGIDQLGALMDCIDSVRRGGTISISGVYGGMKDPLPMMQLFDKGVTIRMGQAHVKRWIDDLLPLLQNGDPLGTDDLATHLLPLDEAPNAYETFQKKEDMGIKIVLQP